MDVKYVFNKLQEIQRNNEKNNQEILDLMQKLEENLNTEAKTGDNKAEDMCTKNLEMENRVKKLEGAMNYLINIMIYNDEEIQKLKGTNNHENDVVTNNSLQLKSSQTDNNTEPEENDSQIEFVPQNRVETLERDLAKKSNEIENLNLKCNETFQKIKDMEKLENQEEMKKRNEENCFEIVSVLQKKIETLEDGLASRNKEIENLNLKYNEALQEITDLKKIINNEVKVNCGEIVSVLQKKIETLEDGLPSRNKEIENLNLKYNEALQEITDLKKFNNQEVKAHKIEQEVEVEIPGLRQMMRGDLNTCIKHLKLKLEKGTAAYKEADFVASESSSSVLYSTIFYSCTNLLHILLNHGLDANSCCYSTSLFECSLPQGEVPMLHVALHGGYIDIMTLLISKGASVNYKNKIAVSNLCCAIKNGFHDIVKFLVSKGADVNTRDHYGATSLHYVARYDCPADIIELLISEGADVNAVDFNGSTPLHYGARYDCPVNILELLICKGAEVNARDRTGFTPLHYVAQYSGDANILKFLISKGAYVNATENYSGGRYVIGTPLHLAVFRKNVVVAKILIDSGADINIKDSNGRTPFQNYNNSADQFFQMHKEK